MVALVGTTVSGPGTAHACSCAIPDPVAVVSDAHVIVHGETIASVDLSPSEARIDRRFLFRVAERYRGDTPEVIEIRVDTVQDNCDDTVTSLWPVMFLADPTPEGWYAYQPCAYQPLVSELDAFFDEVWPLSGRGPPAAIAAVATRDHDLVVLDAQGVPLQYLPGPGPTLGVAACPGGTAFVQLRQASWDGGAVELAVWQYAGWAEVGTVVIDAIRFDPMVGYPAMPLACLASDGLTSFIGWDSGLDVVGSAVTPHQSDFTVVAPGRAGYELVGDGMGLAVARPGTNEPPVPVAVADPFTTSMLSIEVTDTGWRVTVLQNRFPERTALLTIGIGLDGTIDEPSTAFIDVPIHRWTAVPIDPAVASMLTIAPGATPTPLFERSGSVLGAPAPALPVGTAPPSVTPAPSVPATPPAQPSALPPSEPTSSVAASGVKPAAPDDRGGSTARWAIGGTIALLAVALVGFAAVRRIRGAHSA